MSLVFFCGYVPSGPDTNSKVQTHKPDQTKLNINGFDITAKSAAKLLYGPVLVLFQMMILPNPHILTSAFLS